MIEQQIAAALETVLPGAVWPVIMPQNPAYPAVTYHRRDYEQTTDPWSLNPLQLRQAEGPRALFQVVIYGTPYTRCAELLREVKAALETVPGLMLDSVQDGYEFEQSIYAIITEWTVWGDLEARTLNEPGDWPLIQPFVDAILAGLEADFGDRVTTIGFHDPALRELSLPALVLDMTTLDIGEDTGDGRVPAQASWVIHCLMPQDAEDPELLVRSMAAEVLGRVRMNKWGMGSDVSYPDELSAEQGTLFPGVSGHTHWTVSWQQVLYLQIDEDTEAEFLPEEYYSSFEPATGSAFEAEYEPGTPPCEEAATTDTGGR